jgi:hypothetical protein
MTHDEEKVIAILTSWMPTRDHLAEPIHAVDRAMGWETGQSLAFAADLLRRGIIETKVQLGLPGQAPLSWWERRPEVPKFDESTGR